MSVGVHGDAAPQVLGATVARLLAPGSNRPGGASQAPWVVILPQPAVGEAWVAGRPSAGELAGLSLVAEHVRVIGTREPEGGGAGASGRDPAATGPPPAPDGGSVSTGGRPPGLLWIRSDARLDPNTRDALIRAAVAGGGVVFGEARARTQGVEWQPLRVGPLLGPIRTAHPAGDAAAASIARDRQLEESAARRWLAGHGIPRPRPVLRPILAVERALARRHGRTAWLAAAGIDARQPPAWLRRLALEAGLDLRDHAWVLAARGDYATQKALLVLEPRGDPEIADRPPAGRPPSGVTGRGPTLAKIALDPIAIPRLEAAAGALSRLADVRAAAGRVPSLRFAGRVGGIGVVVEASVDGRPFEQLAAGDARRAAEELVGWLARLALDTSRPLDADQLGSALGRIVAAYETAYAPSGSELRAIATRVEAVARAEPPLRSVFLHGDPGVQNLVVDAATRVSVLDWENGDPAGLPLWDLALFLRSYVVWTTAGRGRGSRLAAARRHLVDGSAMTPWLGELIESYRRALGIRIDLVEPLVTLGWVWLAARDAARLAPATASGGQAVRLARLFLAQGGDCAVLRAVTGGSS